jgi:superfamily II DNA or RNA helicase
MINEERMKIQLEALSALRKNKYSGIVLLPTGTGKSWVLIEALKELIELHPEYENIWYVCNSTDLRDKDFDAELDKWGASHLKERITKMCYQSAYKLKDQKVDILLADELDYSLTPQYYKLYTRNSFTHKLLTTAYIEGETKLNLAKRLAPIVYQQSLQNVEDHRVLNRSEYYYVTFMLSDTENEQYNQFNLRISSLMYDLDHYKASGNRKGIHEVEEKLKRVTMSRKHFLNSLDSSAYYTRKLIRELYEADKDCKMLIFCELTDQADRVCKYSYHGKNSSEDNLTLFRNGDINFLAVCGKVNRGVNIHGIRYQVYESCSQSKTSLTQRLGRGKRLSVDELLKVYFMVPMYRNTRGQIKYTKILDWITGAASHLDLSNAKLYKYKS